MDVIVHTYNANTLETEENGLSSGQCGLHGFTKDEDEYPCLLALSHFHWEYSSFLGSSYT